MGRKCNFSLLMSEMKNGTFYLYRIIGLCLWIDCFTKMDSILAPNIENKKSWPSTITFVTFENLYILFHTDGVFIWLLLLESLASPITT